MKVCACVCVRARVRVFECAAASCMPTNSVQIVYGGSVLSDSATLKSVHYSSSKSLVVTAPPAPSVDASASAASINASIDSAYSACLAADAARQAP